MNSLDEWALQDKVDKWGDLFFRRLIHNTNAGKVIADWFGNRIPWLCIYNHDDGYSVVALVLQGSTLSVARAFPTRDNEWGISIDEKFELSDLNGLVDFWQKHRHMYSMFDLKYEG